MSKYKNFSGPFLRRLADSQENDIQKREEYNDKSQDMELIEHAQVIVNDHVYDGRFRSTNDLVFLDLLSMAKYHVRYERGLTESQHYAPFDDEDFVSCERVEVTRKEILVVKYEWQSV